MSVATPQQNRKRCPNSLKKCVFLKAALTEHQFFQRFYCTTHGPQPRPGRTGHGPQPRPALLKHASACVVQAPGLGAGNQNGCSVIYDSPFDHGSRVCTLVQNIVDMSTSILSTECVIPMTTLFQRFENIIGIDGVSQGAIRLVITFQCCVAQSVFFDVN